MKRRDFINVDTTHLHTGLMYSEAAEFLKSLKGKYFKSDIIQVLYLKKILSSKCFVNELDNYIKINKKKQRKYGSCFTQDTFIFCINENINVYLKHSDNVML